MRQNISKFIKLYYKTPENAENDVYSDWLANFRTVSFVVTMLAN